MGIFTAVFWEGVILDFAALELGLVAVWETFLSSESSQLSALLFFYGIVIVGLRLHTGLLEDMMSLSLHAVQSSFGFPPER